MDQITSSVDDVQRLTAAIVAGDGSVQEIVRHGVAAGLASDAFRPALLAAEREIVAGGDSKRPDAATRAVADRLAAALDQVMAGLTEGVADPVDSLGTVAVAALPGDGHNVGRQLWQALLHFEGYTVRDLGLRAPVIIAREAAALKVDALAINLFDTRSRASLESLVANLLRRGTQLPLLLGGPGVDEAFAQWLAIAESAGTYWSGVYYCSDGSEMLQVLQQIVFFEPPPQAHSHEHDTFAASDASCSSCGGCPLVGACDDSIAE